MAVHTSALVCSLMIFLATVTVSSSVEIVLYPTSSTLNFLHPPTPPNLTVVFAPGVHTVSAASVVQFQGARFMELKAKSNSNKTTVLCQRRIFGPNIEISLSSDVKISGLTFSGCLIEFTGVNNTLIHKSSFVGGRNGGLKFTNSLNLTIEKCLFKNNSQTSLLLKSTSGVHCTRSSFSDNRGSIVSLDHSSGFIGCSNFYNNSLYLDLIFLRERSTLSISNCTFDNNSVSASFAAILRLDSSGDNAVIVNSTFTRSSVHSFIRALINVKHPEASATVIATKFVGNSGSGRHHRSIASIRSVSSDVAVFCSEFSNFPLPIKYIRRHNISYCQQNYTDTSVACGTFGCKSAGCNPPTVELSLERSEYTVSEGIGKSSRALQICAVASDLKFGVQASLQVRNGSASENNDFVIGEPDCLFLKFTRRIGKQKKCAFIRIVDDSVQESAEQFSVLLTSVDPHVTFRTREATVTIVEDSTPATPAPTEETATSILRKAAVVECGPLRRIITYPAVGNELNSLKSAIVQSFKSLTGLQITNIAVLQVKSKEYGYYVDTFSTFSVLVNNSMVRVVPYEGFTCLPRLS